LPARLCRSAAKTKLLTGWKGNAKAGILKLAYKLFVNDKAKFTALLVGITLAVFS
jgi:hypothetical protein